MDATSMNTAMITAALAQYQAAANQQQQNRLLINAAALASGAAPVGPSSQQAFSRNYLTSLTTPTQSQMPLLSHYSTNSNQMPSTQNLININQGPSTASAASSIIDLQTQLYYQTLLGGNSLMCTCACAQTCPLHETASAASMQSSAHQQQSNALSNALLANQLRQIVIPNSINQVIPRGLLQSNPSVNTLTHSLTQQHLAIQQQLQATQQQQLQAAVATSSTQPLPRERTKRPANCGPDGRPTSKVRRINSIDGNTPSSSQVPTERYERAEIRTLPNVPLFRACVVCRSTFGPNVLPNRFCGCHNSDNCTYSGSFCQGCYFQVMITNSPEYATNTQLFDNLNPNHQQTLQTRQTHQQRQRDHALNFYNRNVYETSSPQPMMLLSPRVPYMDIFLLTNDPLLGGSAHSTAQATQQQIQTLHQVLSQNPHMSEPPPVGATLDQIKKNTTVMAYAKDPTLPEQETERCTVCLTDFENADEVRALNCSHVFHIECIDRWLVYNKKCPVCRVEMDKPAGFATIIEYDRAIIEPTAAS